MRTCLKHGGKLKIFPGFWLYLSSSMNALKYQRGTAGSRISFTEFGDKHALKQQLLCISFPQKQTSTNVPNTNSIIKEEN
jgi:hypothetical protein